MYLDKKYDTVDSLDDIDLVMKQVGHPSMVKRRFDNDGNEIFYEEIDENSCSQASTCTEVSNNYHFSQAPIGDYYENPSKAKSQQAEVGKKVAVPSKLPLGRQKRV